MHVPRERDYPWRHIRGKKLILAAHSYDCPTAKDGSDYWYFTSTYWTLLGLTNLINPNFA